ncbi:MAG: transglutaminase-like domain-containing protein [Candidatus Thermoplasmatota archaeon]|jgi:hypothetical protein|nr:transglutaminase-like domain-containing protein [Candidatus Thermoplasmatota archaeon]
MPKVKVLTDEEEEEWDMSDGDTETTDEAPVRSGSLNKGGKMTGRRSRDPPPARNGPKEAGPSKERPKTDKVPKKGPQGKKKGMGVLKWTARILFSLLIVFLLFAPGFPFHDIREATGLNRLKDLMRPYRDFPEWVNVSMEIVFDLTVSNGQADEVNIRVAPAFDIPTEPDRADEPDFVIQDVLDVQLTPDPTIPLLDWDNERNKMTGWELENVRGARQYKARFDATLHSHRWDIQEEESGTVDDIPQAYKDSYLDDEWIVEKGGEAIDDDNDGAPDLYRYHPTDPTIRGIARSITKDEDTVLGMVKDIYQWIKDHFNYTTPSQRIADEREYGSYPKYPLGCLRDWYGDCDDQSLLMASLCRAVGIPAWLEIGYLYDPQEETWGGHGWFNVYIPLKGGDYVIAPIDPVNSEFLFRDPYRITDWIDTGEFVKVDGEDIFNLDYYYNFFSIRRSSGVSHDILISYNSVKFEPHGHLKMYVDEKVNPGNLPGSRTQLSTPGPTPLLLTPILLLVMVPAIRSCTRKRTF